MQEQYLTIKLYSLQYNLRKGQYYVSYYFYQIFFFYCIHSKRFVTWCCLSMWTNLLEAKLTMIAVIALSRRSTSPLVIVSTILLTSSSNCNHKVLAVSWRLLDLLWGNRLQGMEGCTTGGTGLCGVIPVRASPVSHQDQMPLHALHLGLIYFKTKWVLAHFEHRCRCILPSVRPVGFSPTFPGVISKYIFMYLFDSNATSVFYCTDFKGLSFLFHLC